MKIKYNKDKSITLRLTGAEYYVILVALNQLVRLLFRQAAPTMKPKLRSCCIAAKDMLSQIQAAAIAEAEKDGK